MGKKKREKREGLKVDAKLLPPTDRNGTTIRYLRCQCGAVDKKTLPAEYPWDGARCTCGRRMSVVRVVQY